MDEAGNGAIALQDAHRATLRPRAQRHPHAVHGRPRARPAGARGAERPRTPIVLISTLGTENDIKNGLAVGATAYVIKPLSPHEIKLALRKIIDTGPELDRCAPRAYRR